MQNRIIIENRSNLHDALALQYVMKVIAGGRISDYGKCYCYHTEFSSGVHVSAWLNKASDRFVVHRNGEPEASDPNHAEMKY